MPVRTINRIGGGVQGQGWRDVWSFSDEGFRFVPGLDDLEPGGQGAYQNFLRDLKLVSASPNTGTACYVGGPSSYHNGDYFEAQRVMVSGAQTAFLFDSMAQVTFNQVYVTNPVDARGDFGLRSTGGSSNSYHLQSTTIGNCDVAFSFESQNSGNVIYLGDIGMCRVGIKLSNGARLMVVGGNIEATCDLIAEVGDNCTLILNGTCGNGVFEQPPIKLLGTGSRVIRLNTNFASRSGIIVEGAGYGNSFSQGSTSAAVPLVGDAYNAPDERYNHTMPAFKGGNWPIYRTALNQFFPANEANYNVTRDVIRDGGPSEHGGVVRVSKDGTGDFFYDWICREDNPED